MGGPRIGSRVRTALLRVAQSRGEARAHLFQCVDAALLTIDGGIQGFERVLLKGEAHLEFGDAFGVIHGQSSRGSAPVSRSVSGISVQGRRRRTSST